MSSSCVVLDVPSPFASLAGSASISLITSAGSMGVGVLVDVGLDVRVGVGVKVRVEVGVWLDVGVGVNVGVGGTVGHPAKRAPST
ncbi:MAG TPA: hypothetical protein VIK33_00840, partial [Anaerolineae bacterium]